MPGTAPPDWAALEAKYKQDIESLTESAEMAAIEKEIAEEKLDSCEKELQETKDKLAEAALKIEALQSVPHSESSVGAGTSDSTVTVLQLQKVEEQNELMKQALIKLRDMSAKDKKALEDLQIEHEELQIKALDFEDREQKYLEQIKIYEEQIDVSQSAQEMVEKLTQQKTELEDKLKDMIEDLDCMEKLRGMNEELLESARQNEIELTGEIDKLRVQCADLTTKRREIEDYLTEQEKTVAKLKDDNRTLNEELTRLKGQFKEGESIEQQKHQIENVAYKLNFSESRMAEKEAEVNRYKRNLSEMEEQMNNLSIITKEQSTRLDEIKLQYDAKVSENLELQRALRKKMEEVSELEIRREMAEKKLQSVQKSKEEKLASLTRQIELMKGIEIQHEEDMKRLMEDNEIIERERRELRDQLNRSFRSLERTTQTAANASMVTAQDTSLASLGISLQSSPPVQASPGHQSQQQISAAQASHSVPESTLTGTGTNIASALSPLGASRRLFASATPADEAVTLTRIKELGAAFDQVSRRNQELEMELAYNQLESHVPPFTACDYSNQYDLGKTKVLRGAVDKLKREIRAAMINQQICPRSRLASAQVRNDMFNMAKLAMKYQALESEAKMLFGASELTRSQADQPLLQSTPIK